MSERDNVVQFPIPEQKRQDNLEGIVELDFGISVELTPSVPDQITDEQLHAIEKFIIDEFQLHLTSADYLYRRQAFIGTLLGVRLLDPGEDTFEEQ